MVQMLGWFKADAARASRRNRSSTCGSRASSSGRNFNATKRPSSVSSALYTTPMPPPPSFHAVVRDGPIEGDVKRHFFSLCVDRADVGMVQGRGSACLPAKPLQRLRVLGKFF